MYFSKEDRKEAAKKEKERLKELDNTPIDVRSNITPFSYEKITQIRSDLWNDPDANLDFLFKQLFILQQRRDASWSNQHLVQSLTNGINSLNNIINKRSE